MFVTTLGALPVHGHEWNVRLALCGRERVTCVVDGDTIWLQGVNLRLESYDTPEPYNDICCGAQEVALAKKASAPLLALLNGDPFTVETGARIATASYVAPDTPVNWTARCLGVACGHPCW